MAHLRLIKYKSEPYPSYSAAFRRLGLAWLYGSKFEGLGFRD